MSEARYYQLDGQAPSPSPSSSSSGPQGLSRLWAFIMGNCFGQRSQVTSHDRAVLELKVQRDKLVQYKKKIQTVLDRETEIARQMLQAGKKEKALLALKKKKYQQNLLDKADQHMLNLQEMVDSIEFKMMEKKVFDGLKSGTDSLKELQKELSVEAVEKLMEESREAMEYQDEVSRILSQNLTSHDDEAIMAELDELMQGEEEQQIQQVVVPKSKLPAATTTAAAKSKKPTVVEVEIDKEPQAEEEEPQEEEPEAEEEEAEEEEEERVAVAC